jgi:hypothetical protein
MPECRRGMLIFLETYYHWVPVNWSGRNGSRGTGKEDYTAGVWYFFGPFTFYEENQAMWQAARYREDYEKIDGTWKIKHLRVKGPGMSARYEAGWAK